MLNEKRGWGIPSGTDNEGPWGLRLEPDRLKQEDLFVTLRADRTLKLLPTNPEKQQGRGLATQ